MLFFPSLVNGGGLLVGIRAIEKYHFPLISSLFEQVEKEILSTAGFSKDKSFFRCSEFFKLCEALI